MIQQHTAEWHKLRLGRFTSSEIHNLVTLPKSGTGLSEGAKTYIMTKIAELLTGFSDDFSNTAMEWGSQNENLAKQWIEKKYETLLTECGLLVHPDLKYYAGSPDEILEIKDKKPLCVEIKCPFSTPKHLDNIMYGSNPDDLKSKLKPYYWQCQSNMILTDTKECLFVSFDPRINNDYGYFETILPKNEDDCNFLLERLKLAYEYYKFIASDFGINTDEIFELTPINTTA